MTDTERNTALAALFGPEEYKAAMECSQGHGNIKEVYVEDNPPATEWVSGDPWDVGNLCAQCVIKGTPRFRTLWLGGSGPEAFELAEMEIEDHASDPTWHPEWRIQGVPRDFTVPGVLEPLAEALLSRWSPDLPFSMYRWSHQFFPVGPERGHFVTISIDNMDQSELDRAGEGGGTTYEIALGEALLDAVERRGRDA